MMPQLSMQYSTWDSSPADLQAGCCRDSPGKPHSVIPPQLIPLRGLSTSIHAPLAANVEAAPSLPPTVADPADPFAAVYLQLLDSSSFQQLSSVVLQAGPFNVE